MNAIPGCFIRGNREGRGTGLSKREGSKHYLSNGKKREKNGDKSVGPTKNLFPHGLLN